jgi:hypothetical protein
MHTSSNSSSKHLVSAPSAVYASIAAAHVYQVVNMTTPAGNLANMDALDYASAAKLPALMAQPLYLLIPAAKADRCYDASDVAGDLANMDALDPESAAKLPALMALRGAIYSQEFRQ